MASRTKPSKVNLNEATREELIEVAGLRPALADSILKHREEKGPFASFEALEEVGGVGSATLEQLRETAVVAAAAAADVVEDAVETTVSANEKLVDLSQHKAEQLAEASAKAASASAETARSAADETKQTADAVAQQGGEAASTIREVGMLWLSYWPEQIGDNMRTAAGLSSCRSVPQVVELQRQYVTSSYSRLAERVGATVELARRLPAFKLAPMGLPKAS